MHKKKVKISFKLNSNTFLFKTSLGEEDFVLR